MNPGPLVPQTNALTKLRHSPKPLDRDGEEAGLVMLVLAAARLPSECRGQKRCTIHSMP